MPVSGKLKDRWASLDGIEADIAAAGSVRALARALGVDEASVRHQRARLRLAEASAAERGEHGFDPVLPDMRVVRTSTSYKNGVKAGETVVSAKAPSAEPFEVPEGHVVKGVSAFVDPHGRIHGQWIKTKQGDLDPAWVAERIKRSFAGYEPAAPVTPAPAHFREDLLSLFPLADWHVGMHAWRGETGVDWDLKIARKVIGRAVENVVERSHACGTCVVLGGGDLIHSDNAQNRTEASGHALDVDGRYGKVIDTANAMVVATVEACLRKHGRVIVRMLQGNHDRHYASNIAWFLRAWFRHEPRVEVVIDEDPFWVFPFGRVMLAAHHGHEARAAQMPAIMAARWPRLWGEALFRYAHTCHLHHRARLQDEVGGAYTEIHQSPAAQDRWHYGKGFGSGRSLQTITYHRDLGEAGRTIEPILPEIAMPEAA